MRYVNPLVEGSSPSPVTRDRRCQDRTGSVGITGKRGLTPSSTQEHSGQGSGQIETARDTSRLPTATESAASLSMADRELAAIVDAWESLPEAVRAGIVAMVKAASPKGCRE